MRRRPVPRGGARFFAVPLTLALLVTASGCGGGDSTPTVKQYYGAIGTFCTQVAAAAKRVSTESNAVSQSPAATQAANLKRITDALGQFADGTDAALKRLEKAGAPDRFAKYQKDNAAGFRKFISTLRATAHDAEKDPTVLAKLETRLNAVALPDPPKDITANVKPCATTFTAATG
jgi:hypothetical protein